MVSLRTAAVLFVLDTSSMTDAFSMQGGSHVTTECAPDRSLEKNVDVAANLSSRRSLLLSTAATFAASIFAAEPSHASADCFSDCLKNCKLIAPKDPQYCQSNCQDYCAQDDRTDGLSGSTSSSGGEMGILGTSTVVKGEDKPPQVKIPGLDFTSDKGKKLIGY